MISAPIKSLAIETAIISNSSDTGYDAQKASTTAASRIQYAWEAAPISLIPTSFHQANAPDQYTASASEIALLQNCLIRALNSIYLQAPYVPINEYANFVTYSIAVHKGLVAYIDGVETILVPEIEKRKTHTQLNLTDHNAGESKSSSEEAKTTNKEEAKHSFQPALTSWSNYLQSIALRKNNFSPAINRTFMDDILPSLSNYFHALISAILSLEPGTFPPLTPSALETLAKKTLQGRILVGMGGSKSQAYLVWVRNHDLTFEGGRYRSSSSSSPLMGKSGGFWNVGRGKKIKDCEGFCCIGKDGRGRRLKFGCGDGE